jgi:DNA polymerase (family 10)
VLKRAARRGILIAINPDAHDFGGFDDMRYGIVMARKAWLEKKNLLNCMSVEEIDAYFSGRKRKKTSGGARGEGGAKKTPR